MAVVLHASTSPISREPLARSRARIPRRPTTDPHLVLALCSSRAGAILEAQIADLHTLPRERRGASIRGVSVVPAHDGADNTRREHARGRLLEDVLREHDEVGELARLQRALIALVEARERRVAREVAQRDLDADAVLREVSAGRRALGSHAR